MIQEHSDEGFEVGKMAELLKVSRSGYYRFLKGKVSLREQGDARILKGIEKVYTQSRGLYGSPRIHAELRLCEQNFNVAIEVHLQSSEKT